MAKSNKAAAPKSSKSTSKGSSGEGRQSLADLFDDTDSSEASNMLPAGEHEVQLTSMELKKNDKGIGVVAKYTAIDGDDEGKSVRQLYKLTDADGGRAPGMAYLKRDLELLGYTELAGKKLEKTLKKISEEQPMVVITVKVNGQYTNAYLGGLAGEGDNDEIEDTDDDDEEIEVGSEVSFDLNGDEVTGEVTKIKGDTATVKVGKKEHKVDVSDLTLADDKEDEEEEDEEDEEEDEKPTKGKGSKSKKDEEEEEEEDEEEEEEEEDEDEEFEAEEGGKATYDGEQVEIVKINAKKGTCTVTNDDGEETKNVPLDELSAPESDEDEEEDEEEEEDSEEIEVGDEVSFEDAEGEDQTGEVVKLNTKKGVATVKVGKKKIEVDLDDLTKE